MNKKQKILFFENLGNLINSGIPITQALDIIIFQTKNNSIKKIILEIKKGISNGESLYRVALNNRKIFNIFDTAMLEIGDSTGQVGKVLEIISEKEDKELSLKRKINQALIYPISIIIVTIIMITIIMIYVIPKIENIYKDANVSLPELTTQIIKISHFFSNYMIHLSIGFVGFFYFFYIILKIKKIKYYFDKEILYIPIFGELLRKKILINFSDFLGVLLSSGIIINKALLIIKNGTGNSYYSKEFESILEDVKNGKNLSDTMGSNILNFKNKKLTKEDKKEFIKIKKRVDMFPIELSTSVKIGEQTGSLSKMLLKSSLRYTRDVDNIIKNLSSLMEPIIIVVIGGVIGTIILGILLPFLNVSNVIK